MDIDKYWYMKTSDVYGSNPNPQNQPKPATGMDINLTSDDVEDMKSQDGGSAAGIEDIDYGLPTDNYEISGVLDDVILGELYDPSEKNEHGDIIKDGLVVPADNTSDSIYEVMIVKMVGENVKEVKAGDVLLVSKAAGMRVIDFDGATFTMTREVNVFAKLKIKNK